MSKRVGFALGPIVSGLLVNFYGFRKTFDLKGIGMTIFTVLYICLKGNISPAPPSNQDIDTDDNFVKYKQCETTGPRSSALDTDAGTTVYSEFAE